MQFPLWLGEATCTSELPLGTSERSGCKRVLQPCLFNELYICGPRQVNDLCINDPPEKAKRKVLFNSI